MKLWIRTTKGDKTTNSVTTELDKATITAEAVTELLRDALSPLDIPTPSVLHTHVVHLARFNIARFRPYDFVEHVDFDALVVEIMRGEDEKRPHKRIPLDEV